MRITGTGKPLSGEVDAGGSKNSALPCLIASLLNEGQSEYTRVPALEDIRTTLKLLEPFGTEIVNDLSNHRLVLSNPKITSIEAPYDVVRTMRASVLVLGPLLARRGEAKVSLPGGCAIGARPIDIHLKGFEAMGATIVLEKGYVHAKTPPNGLQGAVIPLSFPSVGATENLMMAATLARGKTVLQNAAREPEIVDLAQCLKNMGAQIEGEGSSTITIEGVGALGNSKHEILGDRIEAGTLLLSGLITGGDVKVKGIRPDSLEEVLKKIEETGAKVERGSDFIRVMATPNFRAKPISIRTEPFPGFPTDMQAQFMALFCLSQGTSVIEETVFESRFQHAPELARMGAKISISGNQATIEGVSSLLGAPVMATDLRASASLILAGLVAKGETILSRIYHLDRGYEKIENKLQSLGAQIKRI